MWVTHLSPFPNSEILKSGDHTSFTWHMAYISYMLTNEEKRKKRERGREGKRQGGRKEKRKERREAGRTMLRKLVKYSKPTPLNNSSSL